MPINSVTITATPEEKINTYYITENRGNTVFVHTTLTKIKALVDILNDLDVLESWGELKDYCGIYEL